MNKRLRTTLWFLFVGLIIFAGCSLRPLKNLQNHEFEDADDIDSDLIIVGFSQLGSESDWRTANTKSIQNALVKENGFSLIFSNGRQNQENQIKDVRSFIFQEVDYILIAPVTETGWDTVLKEAKEAGIPVIIVDRMIKTEDENLFIASVGTDKYAEGVKAGIWLEEYLEKQKRESISVKVPVKDEDVKDTEDINILILEGTPNSTAQIGRSKGFEDTARHHAEWKIIARENGDFTKAKGKEVMVKLLQDLDNIDVLISQNDDMTFGAIEAIQEAGLTCGVNGEITIISFDAVSAAFDMMEKGLINVDIECNPLQGQIIAQIIESIEKGKKVAKVSYVEGKVFEAENASVERIGRSY